MAAGMTSISGLSIKHCDLYLLSKEDQSKYIYFSTDKLSKSRCINIPDSDIYLSGSKNIVVKASTVNYISIKNKTYFNNIFTIQASSLKLDGVELVDKDLILIKDEKIISQNGLYNVSFSSNQVLLTKSKDEITLGSLIHILNGFKNKGKLFHYTSSDTFTSVSENLKITNIYANSTYLACLRSDNEIFINDSIFNKEKPFIPKISTVVKIKLNFDSIIILDDNNNLYSQGDNTFSRMGVIDKNWNVISSDVLDFEIPTKNYNPRKTRLYIKKKDNFWYVSGYNASLCGVMSSTTGNLNSFTKLKFSDNSYVENVLKIFPYGCDLGSGCILQTKDLKIWGSGANLSGELGDFVPPLSKKNIPISRLGFIDITSFWGFGEIQQCIGFSGYYSIDKFKSRGCITMLKNNKVMFCGSNYDISVKTSKSINPPNELIQNIIKIDGNGHTWAALSSDNKVYV